MSCLHQDKHCRVYITDFLCSKVRFMLTNLDHVPSREKLRVRLAYILFVLYVIIISSIRLLPVLILLLLLAVSIPYLYGVAYTLF